MSFGRPQGPRAYNFHCTSLVVFHQILSFNVQNICQIPVLSQVPPYCAIMDCVTQAVKKEKKRAEGGRNCSLNCLREGSLKPLFWAYEVFSRGNVSLYGTFVRARNASTSPREHALRCHGQGKEKARRKIFCKIQALGSQNQENHNERQQKDFTVA